MEKDFKSGFAALIGRPNVGKSSLLNYIMGEKVSIISDKIQTTRQTIQGIYTDDEAQIIFVDTPGVHKPKHRLGDFMVDVSLQTLNDVDVVLFLINAEEGYGKGDQFIIDKLKEINKEVILVINKVDLIHPDKVLELIVDYKDKHDFKEIIPISARNGNNVDTLLKLIKEGLEQGPQYYDADQLTNRSLRYLVSELIREKILHHTKEEVPHSIAVVIESMKNEDKKMRVQAVIITERSSQKGIIIGKQGKMLKRIGQEARKDMELLLGEKVYLETWVKVQKDWRNKLSDLEQLGFDKDL